MNSSFYCRIFYNYIKLYIFFISLSFLFCGKQENSSGHQTSSLQKSGTASSKTHINLATLEWLPYVGEELENKGYVTELVKEVFQSQGITADIQFLPFARILNMAKEGRIDGYFPEYMNEENKEIYYYSDPYPGGDIGFLKLKKGAYESDSFKETKDFHSLEKFRIGVVRGYVNTAAFDKADYLKKEEAASDLLNLKKLVFGRVDMIVIDRNVSEYLASRYLGQYNADQSSLQFIEPGLDYKELYTCFSKKSEYGQYYTQKFNSGLSHLKNTGKLKEILDRNNFLNGRYKNSRN
ncbi:MAG TPA: transporter substrate-binding domain-containing protein [Leptospiraceae bacterium]|nr:transporter substrate-binding domain-containing protein [Leptospiraceae bacterium]HMY66387.1 transporter substrate-binding domain-containing protein [Leptospiraceae bacterium]HNF13212.1 transporter substrate-binding domain-containing protein [Leptospiraceae bacterium]HNI25005.1 transporter substrate-binding domain-containing protein [Leptospiraceae bacterium]HNJ00058.1 transporter substrate-binding domain-containing protein [Leptospiraceae bacterium]